jgi:hypothetical protein
MSSESVVGGWSSFTTPLSPEAKSVFDQTVGKLRGVVYTPLAFAVQVVAGLNYCFLTGGQVVVPGGPQFVALTYVYAPLHGEEPYITDIKRLKP